MVRVACALLPLALAAAAQDEAPAFPRHLDAHHTTLLVVPDPLPNIEAVLESARFRRLVTDSRFGRAMARIAGRPDPRQWLRDVREAKHHIPSEIALGFTEEGLLDIAGLFDVMLSLDLLWTAQSSGEEAVLAEIPALRAKALVRMRAVRAPRFTLFVRFRGRMEAQGVAQILGLGLRALAEEGMVELKPLRDGAEVALRARSFLDEEELELLAEALAGDDAPEGDVRGFARTLEKLELRCRLEQVGDGVRLAFGAPPGEKAPDLDPASLGPLFRLDAGTLAFASWSLAAVQERARRFRAEMEALQDTPLGRHCAAADTSGMMEAFLELARAIEAVGAVGSSRAWMDDAFHVRAEERGAAPAEPTGLVARALPAEAEIVAVDGRRSVAGLLGSLVLAVEDRLAMFALREELKPFATDEAASMEEAYYEHFAGFRKALFTDLPQGFLAPSAVVATSRRGRLRRFSVRQGTEPAAALEGGTLPEVAMLGRVTGIDALRPLSATYARLAEGIAAATGTDAKEARLSEADLGLGARTWVLGGAWLEAVLAEAGHAIEIDGDFRPHAVLEGELMVLSSSPRLSRAILAAHRGEEPRLDLVAEGGDLVAAGRIPGSTLAALMERTVDVIALVVGPDLPGDPPETVRDAVAGAFELLDLASWTVVDRRDLRVTELHVTFAK